MMHYTIISDEGYGGLNPVLFGYENCEKSHHYGPAVRTHWLIHYVESGYGIFRIKGKEYNVSPGEMFIAPPFEEIYYEADSQKPWKYIWIAFTTDKKLPIKLRDVIHCPEASAIFNFMKKCSERTNGRSAFLSARLWDLFSLLLGKEKDKRDYIETALDCMHSEYMHGITVEQIAARLSLDRTYFSTIFKQKMGLSPKQYLLNYRMGIAISLMLDKKKNVSVAACSVGYNDIYTFSKTFKRHFGLSPKEYIKQKKAE